MTNNMNNGIDVTDIAPPSGDAWKPEIGDLAKGVIIYAGTSVRKSYDGTKDEESLRVDLETDGGDTVTVWSTTNTDVEGGGWAKRDAKAIAAAVRAAGCTRLEIGGTLAIKRVDDAPTDRGAAKAYNAEYKPPAATVDTGAGDDSSGAVSGLI